MKVMKDTSSSDGRLKEERVAPERDLITFLFTHRMFRTFNVLTGRKVELFTDVEFMNVIQEHISYSRLWIGTMRRTCHLTRPCSWFTNASMR